MPRNRLRHGVVVSRWRWCGIVAAVLVAVVLPFALYDHSVRSAVEEFVRSGHTRPVVAVAIASLFVVDVFLPVPSSLAATASGMLLGFEQGALVTWSGMQAGALLGYAVGRFAGRRAANRLVGDGELESAERSHRGWGGLFVIVSRGIPVLAESSVIFAGLLGMRWSQFAALTSVSNAGISVVYAWIGAYTVETNGFLVAFAASVLLLVLLPGAMLGLYSICRRAN